MNFRPASPPHSPAFAEGGGERRLAVEMKEPFRQSMVKKAVAGNGMTCREMEFCPAPDPLSRQGEIQNSRTAPRTAYAEAKAAAVEDLRTAGWASWKRGKDALDKFPDWSEIPPQVQADWAVYPNKDAGEKSKHIVAGKEQFTLHYCKKSDGKHYYSSIHEGGFPTAEERESGKLGGISDVASVQAAFDEIPDDGKLEALGYTHILQWFRTNHDGRLVC